MARQGKKLTQNEVNKGIAEFFGAFAKVLVFAELSAMDQAEKTRKRSAKKRRTVKAKRPAKSGGGN